ncbi:hypothetical protein H0I29_02845 [Polaribacter sp. R2A056_3_33]|uniref:hypothetical protein n=1 Tax=Polaribacter sp. R2A056_3_33 TaxID=2745563 RepID=UPI001C4F3552|nr:hypothetical protein [Polaribacter sp. R2A056_3_33]QXP71048.1 hypothetical protein H0I29_02845 [Polaribacter sp. R2A056_3_33]
MEKIFDFLKILNENDDELNLKICLNPEILDDYFYIKDRQKHHICQLKEIYDNDSVFDEIINSHKISENLFVGKVLDSPCDKCTSFCSKNVSPFFNCVSYFVSINIQNKLNSNNQFEMQKLINHFFTLFSVENETYFFDFEKMWKYFADYDISQEEKELSKNDIIQNMEYLNEYKNVLNTVEIRMSTILNKEFKTFAPQIKFIENKEKYFDRALFINIKKDLLKKDNQSTNNLGSDIANFENDSNNNPRKTKSQIILEKLNQYGFSKLEILKDREITPLIEHIFINTKAPYQIAYLWFLGFVNNLDEEYCKSQKEIHELLEKITDIPRRSVRGNINGIRNEFSTDRRRYTAYKHIEDVKKHYQTLK